MKWTQGSISRNLIPEYAFVRKKPMSGTAVTADNYNITIICLKRQLGAGLVKITVKKPSKHRTGIFFEWNQLNIDPFYIERNVFILRSTPLL